MNKIVKINREGRTWMLLEVPKEILEDILKEHILLFIHQFDTKEQEHDDLVEYLQDKLDKNISRFFIDEIIDIDE